MKDPQLKSLIQLIVKQLLKEYSSSIDMQSSTSTPGSETNVSVDQMTPGEISKARRDAEKVKREKIRTADMDLKSNEKQQDYFLQQVKMNKLKTTAQKKELQNLKAGKAISVGGAGSISP